MDDRWYEFMCARQDQGWIYARIPRRPAVQFVEMVGWADANIGSYHNNGPDWLFESEADAIIFKLKYGCYV